jgi:hypothetical protein
MAPTNVSFFMSTSNREREYMEDIWNKALGRGEVNKRLEKISQFSCLMKTNYINIWKMWHTW